MAECRREVKNGIKEIVKTNINDLPNDVLEHILSYLPTREVVQTYVLSQMWRYIWKSVPTIKITESIEDCHNILDPHVILHRGDISIHTCQLHFVDYFSHQKRKANSWIFYALLVCNVKELNICVSFDDDNLKMANQTIISKHLRKLVLDTIELKTNFVDFTSCPLLEDLEMSYCIITGNKIISNSLKHLRMEDMVFRTYEVDDLAVQILICVPNLVSLSLFGFDGWTPLFESMPSLVSATVVCNDECSDACMYSKFWDCGNEDCRGCYARSDHKYGCLLLDRLSSTTHMELINDYRMVPDNYNIANIFYRDLRWSPLFRNLKTLVLNEWFLDNGLWGLLCIVKCSPSLEKITLKLYTDPEQMVDNKESYDTMVQPFVTKQLKKIKVKCEKEMEWVKNIVITLTKFGIPQQIICVEEVSSSSRTLGLHN
uniref:F-box domain-containing protein n=1 Tax=Leersia perrieri TaxID=77586 RepID=A0A0D9XHV1_9ORYZ